MQMLKLTRQGVDNLLNNYIYRRLVTTGRELELQEIIHDMESDDIYLPEEVVRENFEFVCDLYDTNEEAGWNDIMYPNRKVRQF